MNHLLVHFLLVSLKTSRDLRLRSRPGRHLWNISFGMQLVRTLGCKGLCCFLWLDFLQRGLNFGSWQLWITWSKSWGCECLPDLDGEDFTRDSSKDPPWSQCPGAPWRGPSIFRLCCFDYSPFVAFLVLAIWTEDRKPEQNERRRKAAELHAALEGDQPDQTRDLIIESLRYMRLSTAAYGRVALRPGIAGITESNFVQLLCKHVGERLNPDQVRIPSSGCFRLKRKEQLVRHTSYVIYHTACSGAQYSTCQLCLLHVSHRISPGWGTPCIPARSLAATCALRAGRPRASGGSHCSSRQGVRRKFTNVFFFIFSRI